MESSQKEKGLAPFLWRVSDFLKWAEIHSDCVAVTWMPLPKPLILWNQHLQRLHGRAYGILGNSDTDSLEMEHDFDSGYEEVDFSEIFVH